MPETTKKPKRQARKYVKRIARVLANDAKAGKPTDLESVIAEMQNGNFASAQEFCGWLAARVETMIAKNDTSKLAKASKAILNLVKTKYADHPEYFVTAGNDSADDSAYDDLETDFDSIELA